MLENLLFDSIYEFNVYETATILDFHLNPLVYTFNPLPARKVKDNFIGPWGTLNFHLTYVNWEGGGFIK